METNQSRPGARRSGAARMTICWAVAATLLWATSCSRPRSAEPEAGKEAGSEQLAQPAGDKAGQQSIPSQPIEAVADDQPRAAAGPPQAAPAVAASEEPAAPPAATQTTAAPPTAAPTTAAPSTNSSSTNTSEAVAEPQKGGPQPSRDAAVAQPPPSAQGPVQRLAAAGPPGAAADASPAREVLYRRHCSGCHGEKGDGRGVAAQYLFPKPRDFRSSKFRLVSTSNGVPTRADIDAVLVRGMPGSAMPPWAHLTDQERGLLVDQVLEFRRAGARARYIRYLKEQEQLDDEEIQEEEVQQEIAEFVERQMTPGQVTEVPHLGAATPERVTSGRQIYLKQGCQGCHGETGKGDGVKEQFDDEGYPTRPRDYTRGIFKGGHDAASLYRRIAYGMPGTPMPASSNLTPEQNADLVYFILSLSDEAAREAAVLRREKIVVRRMPKIPEQPASADWSSIAPVPVRTVPLWWRDDADPRLEVQAVHDGKSIAVRLRWHDATPDRTATKSEAFEDAVALELVRGDAEPFLGMGAADQEVDVWFWDADRQAPVAGVEETYPRTVVDSFPLSEKVAASAEIDRPGARMADQPDVSLPARASGNPIVPTGAASGASALAAAGPGTVTFRLPKSSLVSARGQWDNGQWTVVMTRPLAVSAAADGVALEPSCEASVAFAVWDGAHQDRDGKKLITIWQDLVLEP